MWEAAYSKFWLADEVLIKEDDLIERGLIQRRT